MSREALPALYLSAAVAVVPSVCFEVFPTSAIEALSYGLPVIGSNIGGIPEAVLHGQTGFLVEPGDAHALARQIDALWSAPDLRASMGSAGRILTHQRFSTDHYVGALLAAYEDARSLVRRRPRSST
jgi:glycosyltransferase involved in cell wall biosynthesis